VLYCRRQQASSSFHFLMARCKMNRWRAITEIVKSFNEKDKPWHALAALLIDKVVPIIALLYAAGTNIAPLLMR
jgi:hypothetical protein